MKNQHTPGPWIVREHDDPKTREIHDAFGAFASCETRNANLVAAAPDLLAILKKWSIKRIDESCRDSLAIDRVMTIGEAREINAVIAKAEA